MSYEVIVDHVNVILSQYKFPLTLRQIYYRLVANYGYPNKRTSYNALSAKLVKARELGEVDDTRIIDTGRRTIGGDYGFDSPEDFINYKISDFGYNNYTRSPWADQASYVEVWVEKEALVQVLEPALRDLRVVLAPSKGYSSYTYIKRMAVEDRFERYKEKPIIVLDFRDHDPSGIHMTHDLQNRLERYGPDMDINVKRIALTFAQVQRYGLAPNPVKLADTRTPEYVAQYGPECWELDALPPDELTTIVRAAVYNEIDQDAWKETAERSNREREEVEPRLNEMRQRLEEIRDATEE